MTDVIEWTWALTNALGVAFLSLVLTELYAYRQAGRLSAAPNGRRGYFAAILLRFARVSFVLQALFLISGIAAIHAPNPAEERITAGTFAIIVSLSLDLAWLFTLRDFKRIRDYRARRGDA
jgi:hypothetical protein